MFNIQPTEESKGLAELQSMNDFSESGLNALKQYLKNAHIIFWFGEVSPKVKVVLLGTEAVKVFTIAAMAEEFVKTIDPEYEKNTVPNGFTFNPNQDGSATITGEYIDPNAIVEDPVSE